MARRQVAPEILRLVKTLGELLHPSAVLRSIERHSALRCSNPAKPPGRHSKQGDPSGVERRRRSAAQMERYVALVVREPGCWMVLFPDFPGTEAMGFPLHMALWKAKRMIGARATILKSLGQEMPKAMGVSEIVSEPGYKDAIPYIVAIRRSREPELRKVFRVG